VINTPEKNLPAGMRPRDGNSQMAVNVLRSCGDFKAVLAITNSRDGDNGTQYRPSI
jgi:hypothetical protein